MLVVWKPTCNNTLVKTAAIDQGFLMSETSAIYGSDLPVLRHRKGRACVELVRGKALLRWYLVALLCIPFYIGPELAQNFQLNVERSLIGLLVFGCLVGAVRSGIGAAYGRLFLLRPFTMGAFSAYFFWRLLAAIVSPYRVSTFLYINEFMTTAIVPLMFFAIFFLRDDVERLYRILFWSIVFVFAVVAFERLTHSNPFTPLAPAGAGRAIINAGIERGGILRSKGTFEHPLTLGNFVLLTLPLVLFAGRQFSIKLRTRLLLVGMLLAIALFTGSRSTMLLTAVEVAIFLTFSGVKINTGNGGIPLGWIWMPVIPVMLWVVITVVEQRSGYGLFSSYIRQAQIQNGLISIGSQPFLGFGAGPGPIRAIAEAMTYGEGSLRMWDANMTTVDNWYLSVLLGSGYPALISLLMFQFMILLMSSRDLLSRVRRQRLNERGVLGIYIGLTFSCASEMVMMSVLSIFTLHAFYFILAFWLISLQVSTISLKKKTAQIHDPLLSSTS